MIREIIGYGSDDTEVFAARLDMTPERLNELRTLLNTGDDEDLVNVYGIEGELLELVEGWLGRSLDPSLDYFIESSQ